MSNGAAQQDGSHDQAGSRGIESAEIVARIVEYEQSLSVGHTLEFQSHNSVQQFPDELQTRLLGIFECLEWIDRARRGTFRLERERPICRLAAVIPLGYPKRTTNRCC